MSDDSILMHHDEVFPVPETVRARALIDEAKYGAMYAASVEDPEAFWGEQGRRVDWIKPYTKVKSTSFAKPDVSIRWFDFSSLAALASGTRALPGSA